MRWHLNKPPYTVQQEALKRSEGRKGFNWWMEVGLGKTITELNEWLEDYDTGKADFHVVVTLNSFKEDWLVEAENWGAMTDYSIWPQQRDLMTRGRIGVIMNWEALIGSGGKALIDVAAKRKIRFALDEAQKIKTPTSSVSKFAVNFWKDTQARRGLTGSPMTDNVMDLYNPFKLSGLIDGMNSFAFRGKFAVMGGFMGKSIVGIKEDRIEELHRLRDEAGFIATKKQWLDLPEQFWRTRKVPMHPKILPHYRTMEQEFYVQLAEDEFVTADMVVSKLLKLQEISSGFILNEGKVFGLIPMREHPKYLALLDDLEAIGNKKMLVFTHFRWTTQQILTTLQEDLGRRAVAVMAGGMNNPDSSGKTPINEEKRRFNTDNQCRIMVAQATVASAAHTLIGNAGMRCVQSVFFENDYKLLTRTQAEGRNHRGGQDEPVTYLDYQSSKIEKDTVVALQNKLDLVGTVMGSKSSAWKT